MEISEAVLPLAYMGFAQPTLPLVLMGPSHSGPMVLDTNLGYYLCQAVDALQATSI